MQLANAILLYAVLAFQVSAPQPSAIGSEPPRIRGETLNGKPINLPEATAGKLTVLVLGFNKQGGQQTGVWAKHLSQDFGTDPSFTSYTVAVLEDAPALLRGMIKSGIRSGTPGSERDHVVTTVSGEAAWKKFLRVKQKDVPYLVLLDSDGKVRWTGHGPFEQGQYETLKAAVRAEEYRHRSEPHA
jgi:hypothetical protein